jgi:thioesterase domain-containing protein
METATSIEMPRRELSRAKRSLLEKRLRGAFRCSWSRRSTRQRGAAIVPLQPHGSKPPLILAHGAGGGLLWGYRNVAAQLGVDQPVYAIEPRSLGNWRALRTVEDMASAYLQELQQLQKNGPYYLGGYCFGGLIAYEMARQLWLRCERVGALLLIDAAAPNGIYHQLPWWRPRFLLDFTRNCFYWLQDFRHLETNAKHKFIRRKLAVGGRKLLRRLRRQPWCPGSRCESSPDRLDLEEFIDPEQFPDNELELWKIHLQAEIKYRPRPYPGHVVLLRTRGQPLFCSFDPHFGWGELAGAVTVKMLPGAHERIFEEPRVADLGQTLRACLGTSVSQS